MFLSLIYSKLLPTRFISNAPPPTAFLLLLAPFVSEERQRRRQQTQHITKIKIVAPAPPRTTGLSRSISSQNISLSGIALEFVGLVVGLIVGVVVGYPGVGLCVGLLVGFFVGLDVGAGVGATVSHSHVGSLP